MKLKLLDKPANNKCIFPSHLRYRPLTIFVLRQNRFPIMTPPEHIASLTRLLGLVRYLPSPENSQPWEIVVRGLTMEVFHHGERDRIGEFPDDLAVVGIGMMAEAIDLAASTEGYASHAEYFLVNRNDSQPWLRATLQYDGRAAAPLSAGLGLRHSDRRRFAGGNLADPVFQEVREDAAGISCASLYLSNQYSWEFLQQSRWGDEWLFQIPEVRQDFMRWVRFTDKAMQNSRDGLPWRSFLRYPQRRYHWLQSRLWWLGIALDWFPAWMMRLEEFLFDDSGNPSPKHYDDGACVGCVTVASGQAQDLAAAGRLALRAWLLLNLRGYGFQIMTNLTSIVYTLHQGHLRYAAVIPELARGCAVLQRMFGFTSAELPIICFRAGLPIAPYPDNARSLRREHLVRFDNTTTGAKV
jgi:hypothetical protein